MLLSHVVSFLSSFCFTSFFILFHFFLHIAATLMSASGFLASATTATGKQTVADRSAAMLSDRAAGMTDRASAMMGQIKTLQDTLNRYNAVRVDPTEYACLKAIVLFKSG